jgi:hypothetical protein
MAHEWMALAYVAASAALLETMDRSYPRLALLVAYARFGVVVGVASLAVMLLARVMLRRRRWPPLPSDLLHAGRAAVVLLPVLATHFVLKSFTHVLNRRVWDPELSALDRSVHLGVEPARFLVALFDHATFLAALDVFYSVAYYGIVVGSTALLISLLPPRRRLAFTTAFMLVFMAGSALYLALPSWGPVFVWPDDFEAALSHMPNTVTVQRTLFAEISAIVSRPDGDLVIRYGSVAAFPSLHIAVVTLFAAACRSLSRTWFAFSVGVVVLMLVGSVLTGYHFLIDGYAGILLALGAWWAGRRLHPDEPSAVEAPCPTQSLER